MNKNKKIGFACAYTPLALIHAAGFEPYRILPMGDSPDQAGLYLHDNLCPHVKRLVDRALVDDLPDLAGLVMVSSCDAMRKLVDAWRSVRPDDPIVMIDLPPNNDQQFQSFFCGELTQLRDLLSDWSGRPVTGQQVVDSTLQYNELVDKLEQLRTKLESNPRGPAIVQREYNYSVTTSLKESVARLDELLSEEQPVESNTGVPVYLFGNVMPDPKAMELFASAGCRIVSDDLCTGSRQLTSLAVDDPDRALEQLARSLLARPICARTFSAAQPGTLAKDVVTRAKQLGAKGVIAHVMKFCDPYLIRLPAVRQELREAGLPFLVLEGDCRMGSLGQQRTRIEAFSEMIGD
ncbi:MAG: 2-hydroxyacyl-CoA dehydratase [Proteobacteria bacterium]|nr:2-hydroxyacyl-CoA dehydratase [Pseudomonadota bacterium]